MKWANWNLVSYNPMSWVLVLVGAVLMLSVMITHAADRTLAPFKFTNTGTYMRQLTEPVCLDFRDYLNFPRSNDLFKPDGTLIRESKKFKSVKWETLDKAKYREQYLLLDMQYDRDPERKERKRFYDDPNQILQRTKIESVMSDKTAYMQERIRADQQKNIDRQRWLYRVVSKYPKTRHSYDPNSMPELPRGFPAGARAWLGNINGDPYPLDNPQYRQSLLANYAQVVIYAPTGYTYLISNQTYSSKPGSLPRYLRLIVDELAVDTGFDALVAHGTCEYRARNEQ